MNVTTETPFYFRKAKLILYTVLQVYKFGPGLCFYPEFGVPVWSSRKGLGRALVRNSGPEKRTWPNTASQVRRKEKANHGSAGSKFGERNRPNPGSAGSQFEERNRRNPGSAGLEVGEKTGPNPGLAGLEF